MTLEDQHIILGITGSIAAYKSCELIRQLRQAGAQVKVVVTEGALAFVTPMTLQALSGERVYRDLLDEASEAAMSHIELARWADLVLIAPASANCIARLAQGMSDDLLTALCLATPAPVYVAPAMNQQMWAHSLTQANIARLQQHGIDTWGPATGEQACGDDGYGRMLEPDALLAYTQQCFVDKHLSGQTIVITAGPTREAIDPVRYLTNHSSGKMGYALAQAAKQAGANVILISGPVHLTPPTVDQLIKVDTAEQMHQAVLQVTAQANYLISTAAVSDYRPQYPQQHKLKKTQDQLNLALTPTPDIISEIAQLNNKPFIVGFAAETDHVVEHAYRKMHTKHMDMIVANQVGEHMGFNTDDNEAVVLSPNGLHKHFSKRSKGQLAWDIVSLLNN